MEQHQLILVRQREKYKTNIGKSYICVCARGGVCHQNWDVIRVDEREKNAA